MENQGKAVSKKALQQLATQSTRDSARLEQRTVPTDYVRTKGVKMFLAHRDRTR